MVELASNAGLFTDTFSPKDASTVKKKHNTNVTKRMKEGQFSGLTTSRHEEKKFDKNLKVQKRVKFGRTNGKFFINQKKVKRT